MTSPENIINVLKSCSRGKLTYERQSSFSPKQEKSSNQSLKHSLIPDASTLAGSLADVSSVLEDVTSEMSDLQLKRIGHVIDKIKNKEKIDKKAEEIEDENTFVWISPLKEVEETPKKTPKIAKPTRVKFITSPPNDVPSLIQEEMSILESERQEQIKQKIAERKKRLSMEYEERKRKTQLKMEESLRNIQNEVKKQEEVEKQVEQNYKSPEINLEEDKKKSQAAEAALKRAQELKAAKLERRQKILDQIEAVSTILLQLFTACIAINERPAVDEKLKQWKITSEHVPDFVAALKKDPADPEKVLSILVSLRNDFTLVIEGFEKKRIEEEKLKKEKEAIASQPSNLQTPPQNQQIPPQTPQTPPQTQQTPPQTQQTPQQTQQIQPVQQTQTLQVTPGEEISQKSSEICKQITDFRDNYVAKLKQMTVPKDFKFACQKAVTTPLNAISDVSADHLKDKLLKLTALLDGHPVQATENTRFQASNQAELCYAKNLLAKKFVSHGEEVVAAKPKNAFTAGIMLVALWSKHADFGQIFLAYLYEACPYLIPKHYHRSQSESDAEYFKKLGFYIGENSIEDKTMFLKRMSGLTRMYAAISVSRLPGKDSTSVNHPHGIGQIWRLLAAMMNLQPINDITATVMYDLLSVTGAFMFEKYGQVFYKMLNCIAVSYFPKIQAVTEEGCGGPVARLELFLQKALSSKSIERPEGLLRADFL